MIWETSAVLVCFFPAEVLSGGGDVPRDRALQQVSIFLERLDDRIRCTTRRQLP